MSSKAYKGYVIEAAPHQLADDGRWTLDINIERHEDDRIDVRPYSAANTFDTKEPPFSTASNSGVRS